MTLTRIYLPPGLGALEVSFGLAIAWLPLDSHCGVCLGLAIAGFALDPKLNFAV